MSNPFEMHILLRQTKRTLIMCLAVDRIWIIGTAYSNCSALDFGFTWIRHVNCVKRDTPRDLALLELYRDLKFVFSVFTKVRFNPDIEKSDSIRRLIVVFIACPRFKG